MQGIVPEEKPCATIVVQSRTWRALVFRSKRVGSTRTGHSHLLRTAHRIGAGHVSSFPGSSNAPGATLGCDSPRASGWLGYVRAGTKGHTRPDVVIPAAFNRDRH
jgi:hypothetical protein